MVSICYGSTWVSKWLVKNLKIQHFPLERWQKFKCQLSGVTQSESGVKHTELPTQHIKHLCWIKSNENLTLQRPLRCNFRALLAVLLEEKLAFMVKPVLFLRGEQWPPLTTVCSTGWSSLTWSHPTQTPLQFCDGCQQFMMLFQEQALKFSAVSIT